MEEGYLKARLPDGARVNRDFDRPLHERAQTEVLNVDPPAVTRYVEGASAPPFITPDLLRFLNRDQTNQTFEHTHATADRMELIDKRDAEEKEFFKNAGFFGRIYYRWLASW